MTMKKHLTSLAIAAALSITGAAAAQAKGTLDKIRDSGEISLGVRESSGLSYTIGGGKFVGFHTEMAERIIDDLGKTIGKPIKIKYQPITSQNRIPLLQNGTIDLECGSTTNNAARQKDADFAVTTYVEEVRIATKKGAGINSIEDLNNKTVVTTTGTTSVQILRKNKRAENINFKDIQGKDHADSFLMLESGRADAFVMDGSILAANISRAKNPGDFEIVGEVLSVEPIACMLRKDDPEFKKAVDASIVRQIKDGSLEKLYNRWFMEPIPPTGAVIGLPMSEATRAAWNNPNNKPMEDYGNK